MTGVSVVQLCAVYSGSIWCINLRKPLSSTQQSGSSRSRAVISVMSCVIFSDRSASQRLWVGGKCRFLSWMWSLIAPVEWLYESFCIHSRHTTLLLLSSSSKFCQTELIFLRCVISFCPKFYFPPAEVCRRRKEQSLQNTESQCSVLLIE